MIPLNKTFLIASILFYSFCVFSAEEILDISDVNKILPTKEASVSNGKLKLVRFKLINTNQEINSIICESNNMPFQVKDGYINIMLYAGYYTLERNFICDITINKKKYQFLKVAVKSFPYKEEEVTAQPSKVFPSKKDLERISREQAILNKVYAKSSGVFLFTSAFKLPIESERTSIYGDKRIFNKKQPSTHLGNDFRAQLGTDIKTCNDGVVAYTGDLFFSGKTIIIDHGQKVFSMYGHLSKIGVKKGDLVKNGQIVGKSGATGRVSGPHLHWGIKINGEWIDGFSLVEEYSSVGI